MAFLLKKSVRFLMREEGASGQMPRSSQMTTDAFVPKFFNI